jgi:hypothetical protein
VYVFPEALVVPAAVVVEGSTTALVVVPVATGTTALAVCVFGCFAGAFFTGEAA